METDVEKVMGTGGAATDVKLKKEGTAATLELKHWVGSFVPSDLLGRVLTESYLEWSMC